VRNAWIVDEINNAHGSTQMLPELMQPLPLLLPLLLRQSIVHRWHLCSNHQCSSQKWQI